MVPFVPALIGGTSNEKLVTSSRPGQRAAVTNGRRVLAVLCPRSSPIVARVLAGSSVKGDTGGRTRNGAQRVPNG